MVVRRSTVSRGWVAHLQHTLGRSLSEWKRGSGAHGAGRDGRSSRRTLVESAAIGQPRHAARRRGRILQGEGCFPLGRSDGPLWLWGIRAARGETALLDGTKPVRMDLRLA